MADDRGTSSPGPHRTVAADEGSSGPSLRTRSVSEAGNALATWVPPQISAALLTLRLSNPSNLCYLDSIIHLLLHVLPLAPCDLRPTGMLLTALKAMAKHQNKQVKILDMLPWRIVLRDWQHIHTQQDCTEAFINISLTGAVFRISGAFGRLEF